MYWPLESLLVEWDSSPLRLRRLVSCPSRWMTSQLHRRCLRMAPADPRMRGTQRARRRFGSNLVSHRLFDKE